MATTSFLKNIVIKDGKQAERFLKALENAEKKKSKEITINQRVEEIKNAIETIGEKNKLTVQDLYSYSQKHPEWYQEDGVRLNKDGALAVADMVGDCIINKTK